MSSTSTNTPSRDRWIPTQLRRPFLPTLIAVVVVFLRVSAAFSQSAAKSPPVPALRKDKPQDTTPSQVRRESLLDLPALSDRVIQLAVEDELLRSTAVDGHLINVDVADGVVNWLMWQTAMDQALAAGAHRPHNLIEVRYGLPSGPHYYGPYDYVPW